MSPIAKKLVQMMDQEIEQEKHYLRISSVEDCMKAKRLLAGWGIKEHLSVLTLSAEWFDYFMDLPFEELHKELEIMSAEGSEYAQMIHDLGGIGKHD